MMGDTFIDGNEVYVYDTTTKSYTTRTYWGCTERNANGTISVLFGEVFSVPDTKELLDENEV